MSTTTISLERSAYELLKSRKRPGESFSEELRRLLAPDEPRLTTFLELVPARDGDIVADAIERFRAEDLDSERRKVSGRGGRRGRRA